jgi:hypothetical protein
MRGIAIALLVCGCAGSKPQAVTADVCVFPNEVKDWHFKTYQFIPGAGIVCAKVNLKCEKGHCVKAPISK